MSRWIIVSGGLLAAVVVAEGVCRLTIRNPITGAPSPNRTSWSPEGLVPDELVEFSFRPGYEGRMELPGNYDVPFRINGQGLRDDQDHAREHPGRSRILLVGDSYVFGIGVELADTLGERMEAALNADGQGPPVDVVAVGAPAYGLDDYVRLVERWVPELQPDLVIVGLFPGNDLVDYDVDALNRHVVIEGRMVDERQAWNWRLRKYSTLAHVVLQRFNPGPAYRQVRSERPPPDEVERIHRSMEPWMERLVKAAGRPGGRPLAICVIAGKTMIDRIRAGKRAGFAPPLDQVLAALAKAGCSILDPSAAWVAAELPSPQYFFPRDPHYNAEGNRVLGEWLASRVRAEFGARLLAGAGGE